MIVLRSAVELYLRLLKAYTSIMVKKTQGDIALTAFLQEKLA